MAPPPPPTTTTNAGDHPQRTISRSNSMKRRSPSPSLPESTAAATSSEPKPKKHFIEHDECNPHGISLPALLGLQNHAQSYPVLRRCDSDPTHPPLAAPPQSPPQPNSKMGFIDPETPSPNKRSGPASALPPLPPVLRRTVSDLTATPTPPKVSPWPPSPAHTCVDFIGEESPNSKDVTDTVTEADPEELVSVESVGECFTIHFKCPCGKGYQILLSGNSCYYKLM